MEIRLSANDMAHIWTKRRPSSDGIFVVAVKTTGIFCRPTCSAKKPKFKNVQFLNGVSEARMNGYRACKICKPEDILKCAIDTPLGTMLATASSKGLRALEFEDETSFRIVAQNHQTTFGLDANSTTIDILERTSTWLAKYFKGSFKDLAQIPVDFTGTEFEKRVWKTLLRLPIGSLDTYGNLAAKLGMSNAARAIGNAVGSNPVGIIVPCHRIIGSDGKLIGYAGGLTRKQWLLKHEGFLVTGKTRFSKVYSTK